MLSTKIILLSTIASKWLFWKGTLSLVVGQDLFIFDMKLETQICVHCG